MFVMVLNMLVCLFLLYELPLWIYCHFSHFLLDVKFLTLASSVLESWDQVRWKGLDESFLSI